MKLSTSLIQKVEQYQPSPERLAAIQDVLVVLLVGISGAGKNTIAEQLLLKYPNVYYDLVTHTTRKPRANHGAMERHGVHYHFIDFETASQMLDNKDYIEANVYSGNIYGASIAEIERAHSHNRIAIGDIDVNGVANMVRLIPTVCPVFILPPSYELWQQRTKARYGDALNHDDWHARMQTARDEIAHALEADYFYFVLNNDLEQSVEAINTIAHNPSNIAKRSPHALEAAQHLLDEIDRALQT